ncbi:hypothetical protein LMG27174_02150 [Paraburkholderia rhynchosiae]|uniref:Uncharacterized protein n=1 Tax=Paraburkholderia rhynchosiae TaxID=487049 RepID=A0A6J5AT78_9BURK|nr:hypothetical protein LMG27174_02150 [Paraburkholderia rhynchosiae]
MLARAAASTSEAECTDAVVTLKMQTNLAHRRESMYGYWPSTALTGTKMFLAPGDTDFAAITGLPAAAERHSHARCSAVEINLAGAKTPRGTRRTQCPTTQAVRQIVGNSCRCRSQSASRRSRCQGYLAHPTRPYLTLSRPGCPSGRSAAGSAVTINTSSPGRDVPLPGRRHVISGGRLREIARLSVALSQNERPCISRTRPAPHLSPTQDYRAHDTSY